MKIQSFQGGYDKNFSYLIWCEKTNTAAIIDPAVNPTSIIENIESKNLKGLDSLLSIVQMPKGIQEGTLAIGKDGAINAALFSAHILSIKYTKIKQNLKKYRSNFESKVPQRPY